MMASPAQAVVIGASAGAFDALSAILPQLKPGFRLPVLIVVHLPPER
jgi:two-component system chemotaxis response regulator CheB